MSNKSNSGESTPKSSQPTELKPLISQSSSYPDDPELVKAAEEIYEVIINEGPIKVSGRERTKAESDYNESHDKCVIREGLEKDSVRDDVLKEKTIKEIKNIALRHPLTRAVIDEAQGYIMENKFNIMKKFNDVVALYNVSSDKFFYYISSAEARMAIDYVKKIREGHLQEIESKEVQDKIVHSFMKEITNNPLENNPDNVKVQKIDSFEEIIRNTIDDLCGIEDGEFPDILKAIELAKSSFAQKKEEESFLADAKNIENTKDSEKSEILKDPQTKVFNWSERTNRNISVSWFGEMLRFFESADLVNDVVLMNANNIMHVRSWGKTVIEEYDKKTIINRKVFGEVFNAEIYICNSLKDNQIVFGTLRVEPHALYINAIFDVNTTS